MAKTKYNYSVHFTTNKGADTLTTLADNKEHAASIIEKMFEGKNFQLIKVRKLVVSLKAKNYLVLRKEGKTAYSTNIKLYKMVNNKAIFIGSLSNETQDTYIRYVKEIFQYKGSKIDIVQLWRDGKINIQEIYV